MWMKLFWKVFLTQSEKLIGSYSFSQPDVQLINPFLSSRLSFPDSLIDDVDLHVLLYNEFGRNFIKGRGLSPDAFIQLALQLTYYKVHRRLVSTYESAGLRQFKLGRVDNIRAATSEALEWVKAMCDEGIEKTVSWLELTWSQKNSLIND